VPTVPLVATTGFLVAAGLVAGALHAPVAQPEPMTAPGPAVAAPVASTARDGGVVLPLPEAHLVRGFEAPGTRWGPGHRGIDLAADPGTAVLSPAAGVVVFVGRVVDRDVVTVRHADGLRSSLEPVSAAVAVGTAVVTGEVVGHVSTGGHCAGCLHWGVRDGERYVDPLSLLGSDGTVRLLPRAGAGGDRRRRAGSAALALLQGRAQPEHRRGVHLGDP